MIYIMIMGLICVEEYELNRFMKRYVEKFFISLLMIMKYVRNNDIDSDNVIIVIVTVTW